LPNPEILIAFFAATAVFAYMPGPATLYATARTIAGGKRAGWLAALGIHLGGYVHVLAAAFGLAVVFTATPVLYLGLKFVGAAYLIWLGFRLIRTPSDLTPLDGQSASKSPKRAFWDSVTVEILNPKTALFYIAFLPQFTDQAALLPIWLQLLILGTVVNIMFSSADILCVLLAVKIMDMIKGPGSFGRIAQYIGGTILITLGLRLAISHN